MMQQPHRNKYLETSVQTASPAQLMIMLWDGAIRYSKLSIEAMNNGNYQDANSNLQRVQDIISEFMITLDRTSSIAEGLLSLYDYFQRRLIEANIQKRVDYIEEVMGFLIEMKETWVQAAMMAKTGSTAGAARA